MRELFERSTAGSEDPSRVPRTILLFAHQDDEVVAVGGRITRFRDAHLIHVTDGAPADQRDSTAHGFASRKAYSDARRDELSAVLASVGLANLSRECLGYVDQSASFHLAELTRKLEDRIEQHQPEVIFTHPYEGGHPDHDACAFAVHHAVRRKRQQAERAPLIIEAPFYHLRDGGICTGEFLPTTGFELQQEYLLSPEERRRKHELLACFRTQQNTLQQFSTERERFRVAPEYDFTHPPHTPPLFYDHFPWGMSSEHFCRLAEQTQILLTHRETPPWHSTS